MVYLGSLKIMGSMVMHDSSTAYKIQVVVNAGSDM